MAKTLLALHSLQQTSVWRAGRWICSSINAERPDQEFRFVRASAFHRVRWVAAGGSSRGATSETAAATSRGEPVPKQQKVATDSCIAGHLSACRAVHALLAMFYILLPGNFIRVVPQLPGGDLSMTRLFALQTTSMSSFKVGCAGLPPATQPSYLPVSALPMLPIDRPHSSSASVWQHLKHSSLGAAYCFLWVHSKKFRFNESSLPPVRRQNQCRRKRTGS